MSQIKLDHIAQLTAIEPIMLGTELLQVRAAPTEPFGNHLQRAKTHTGERPSRDVADRTSTDRASDDRTQPSSGEFSSAADADTRDVESRDASTDREPSELAEGKPATEAQSDTGDGEQTDSVQADPASKEEAEAQGDGQSDEVDAAIGAAQIKADLPTETADERSGENASESGSAKIAADGEETTGPNTKGTAVAEEQAGETSIANSTAAKNIESGQDGQEDGADGKNRQISAEEDTGKSADLDRAAAKIDSAADRPQKEAASGEGLVEENAARTDTTARQQQADAQDAGTDVSTNRAQQRQSEMQGGKDGRSRRQEKKPSKNLSTQERIADAPPQQTTGDDPTALSADPKTAKIEPTAPAAAPQVDTAEGSIKPVGTADSLSSTSLRPDANRPGRATAASQTSANAAGPEGVDQARFVGRVARAFQAMGGRNGPIRLKLSPPELGSLRIEITVRGGVMTAQLEAETATARTLLLDNLPALRDRLAQQGIKIEQFDVDLSDRSPGGLPDQRPDHADADGRREREPATRGANREESDREEDGRQAGPITRSGEGSQLNVIA